MARGPSSTGPDLCEDGPMIIVAGPITFDPRDWPTLEAAWDTVRPATIAEPGCLEYDAHIDRRTPGVALLFERWESAEAMAAHQKTPHVKVFNKALKDLPSVNFDFTVYDATPR